MLLVATKSVRPDWSEPKPPQAWMNLAAKCWAQEPDDRPTFGDVLKEIAKLVDVEYSSPTPATKRGSKVVPVDA